MTRWFLLQSVVAINVNYNNRVQSMKRTLLSLMATALMSATALAADIKPAILFDLGGKFDKSFNEAAFNGATKFTEETGVAFREFEISNDAQNIVIDNLGSRHGVVLLLL